MGYWQTLGLVVGAGAVFWTGVALVEVGIVVAAAWCWRMVRRVRGG